MAVAQPAIAHTPIVVGPGLSPLEGARIDVEIDDLLAEFTLTQQFRNTTAEDIEAVFTFPVPLDAVYLGLTARLGERELEGSIIEKQQARHRYETAISRGDSAVLVERAEPGLLTSNVGNLRPGETLSLRLRFAHWLNFNGKNVVFRLPTTIAPRYGTPQLQPREAPVTDLLAQYGFAAHLRIRGLLARAELHSPSHLLVLGRDGDVVTLSLKAGSMDRDFLLDAAFGEVERCGVTSARDGDGQVVSVTMAVDIPSETRPLDMVLVVDCSGSMGGTSIEQARSAMKQVLQRLDQRDRIELVRYGSSHRALFGRLCELDRDARSLLEEQVAATEADLGGTETVAALEEAAGMLERSGAGSERDRVIFLITDGAIESPSVQQLHATCRKHGLGIFAVGVGMATGETAIRALCEATGGVAEFVHPNQSMAAHVVRHFERVRAPAARITGVEWPAAPRWSHIPSGFCSGDTLRLAACFNQPVEGEVVVRWQASGPQEFRLPVRLAGDGASQMATLSRMTALQRFNETQDREERVNLAVRYQLLTEVTAAILVAMRADGDKASDSPSTVRVPQMMAAGYAEEALVACRLLDISEPGRAYAPAPPRAAAFKRLDSEPTPTRFRRLPPQAAERGSTALTWRRTDAEAMLSWIDREFARLLTSGGDIDAGTDALILRCRRMNGQPWSEIAAKLGELANTTTDWLGLLVAIAAKVGWPNTRLPNLEVAVIRRCGAIAWDSAQGGGHVKNIIIR